MTTALLDEAAAEKRSEKGGDADISATESPYLLLATTNSTSSSSNSHLDCRTGRWADEEMDFCDFLMQAFDKGLLPMASGIRMNDFLCNMLLCKASRLTKKMKNARLSARSYQVVAEANATLDFEVFSQLQERFLASVTNKSTRLELRFHMNKTWRTNLSNLCIQIGSQLLDAEDWLTSLEALERRGVMAEENIRKARRRRMGLALKVDATGSSGVLFSGAPMQPKPKEEDDVCPAPLQVRSESPVPSTSPEHDTHIANLLDLGEAARNPRDDNVDDLEAFLSDFVGGGAKAASASSSISSSPSPQLSFLEEVMSYIENSQLPFQHIDIWVPSYQGKGGQLRLYHAGHSTRSDCVTVLHEYGEYSTKFSFPPGVGLPGRVYSSGKASWETRLDLQNPKVFERAGGAKVYGVQTGVGLPLTSAFVGRLVLIMYSQQDIPLDSLLLQRMERDLGPLCPKPRWKLVVEMDTEMAIDEPQNVPAALPPAMDVETLPLDVEIANLLTDHLPGAQFPGQHTGSDGSLLPYYMSLRLLLLRDADKRSPEDSNLLDVIRKSYEGFTSPGSNTRSRKEISDLLVKDWKFLKAAEDISNNNGDNNRSTSMEHQSHVMNPPRVQTFAPLGAPARVPFALGVPSDSNKRQRTSPEMVNIVDDSSS